MSPYLRTRAARLPGSLGVVHPSAPWTSALRLGVLGVLSLLGACADAPSPTKPNFLILVGDDVGVEQLASFGIGVAPATTPHLDALAENGTQFSQVWAQPMCSPTRATLLTGRYGFRTGVGVPPSPTVHGPYPTPEDLAIGPLVLPRDARPEMLENLGPVFEVLGDYRPPGNVPSLGAGLPRDERTLPMILSSPEHGYDTAIFGKWHLADRSNGWLDHPQEAGFQHASVTLNNQPESFYAWYESVNGRLEARNGYAPSRKIDDAIAWLDERTDRPWFLWLAFSLPHYPHHVPDVDGLDTSGVDTGDSKAIVDVMISRMDQEIGRLLSAMPANVRQNTIVVFVGDNGTTGEANDPPFHADRGKFTLYEGGLRVPLVFAGPGVPPGVTSQALVNTTDLFATVLDLAGVTAPRDRETDSVSLVPYFHDANSPPTRRYAFADAFFTVPGPAEGAVAIRDARFKLIRGRNGRELYDLANDPYERRELLADGESTEEREAIAELERILFDLRGE